MSVTFEDIKKANESILMLDIKEKDYAPVNERIKAFRMNYPEGFIHTYMQSNVDGVCIFTAEVGYFNESGEKVVLANGTAFERQASNYINKTSYIENCETSAVGRALGMAGYGIDTSVASAEEVQNAINNQNKDQENNNQGAEVQKATPAQVNALQSLFSEDKLAKILAFYHVESLADVPMTAASKLIEKVRANENAD